MKRILLATFLLLAVTAHAQLTTHVAYNILTGGTLPAACSAGDVFGKTGALAGFYYCPATNTWVMVMSAAGLIPIASIANGAANQVLGTNAAATANEWKTLTSTANQVTVAHTPNTITFSTPQSIATASTPQFARIGLGVAAGAATDITLNNGATIGGGIVSSLNISALGFVTIAGGAQIQGNTFLDKIYYYNGFTAANGVPVEYGTVDLTAAQTSAIGATTMYANPASIGQYRVCYFALAKKAGNAVNLNVLILFTSPDDSSTAQTITSANVAMNSVGAYTQACPTIVAKASTNIQYQTTLSGGIGSGEYTLWIKVEKL